MTFTDTEISFELALIPRQVKTDRNNTQDRYLPMMLVRIRWTDEYDIKVRREVWEDRDSLDRILHKTHAVTRIVILVPAVPEQDHLDVGTGDDHLFYLRELWERVRYRPWVHLVIRGHEMRPAIL